MPMEPNGNQSDMYLETGVGNQDIISDFYSWIQKLPSYYYRYVVVTTRRAFNLLQSTQNEYPDVLPNYITESALLLQAEEVARTYKETGVFPKIAVIDDVLVYGRNMNLLLSQFWSTVRQCLNQLDDHIDMEDAEAAFSQSIHLWIYAVNKEPILLRHEFQLTMHSQKILSERQWRSLSDIIARRIATGDVANTSYVISAVLPCSSERYQPNSALWVADRTLCYRNNHHQYAFYLFSPAAKPGIYPSVRSYRKKNHLYFTPYFFMPELSWHQLVRILKASFDISARQDLETTNACIHLLNRIPSCPSRMTLYAQFATLLLSQITLSVFFSQLGQDLELTYDTDKIVHNFDLFHDSESILHRFCKIKWQESHLTTLLNCLETPDDPDELFEVSPGDVSQAEIVNNIELLIYRQAVDHERDAAGRLHHELIGAHSDPLINRTGEQDLSRFLARVKERTRVRTDVKSMLPVLSCLTQMMDLGDISLKARFRHRNGIPVFYASVRTTEMSLAIMPRKLANYYRPFHLLARLYWRDEDFPDRAERYFRDVIFSGDPDYKHTVMIQNARYFAQLITENRILIGSMLNWEIATESEI